MKTAEQVNTLALEKFGLKLSQQTDTWVEYTDGIKTLFIDKECFHYYFNSSESAVPVTPDIVMLTELIREYVLCVAPKYDIFKVASIAMKKIIAEALKW